MTLQEIFNRSYTGVLSQGRRSMNEYDACVYFTSPTCKCGIGWLLPDGVAQELDAIDPINGTGVYEPPVLEELSALGLDTDKATVEFLMKLQNAHDGCNDNMTDYRATMSTIAQAYGLTIPETFHEL